jgi:hypothetical protein
VDPKVDGRAVKRRLPGAAEAAERGVEVVEFIGIIPWLLIMGLVIWQLLIFSQVALVAPSAAREGARAAAANEDCEEFVRKVIGWFKFSYEVECGSCEEYEPVEAEVRVQLPIVRALRIPFVKVELPAKATFRCEPKWE